MATRPAQVGSARTAGQLAQDGGPQVAGAAALAVEQVNADKNLLPGRVLEYNWRDSGCSAKQGLKAMGELLVTLEVPRAS